MANFENGGVTSLADTTNWLVNELKNAFPHSSKLGLLVEDSWAKPSDIRDDGDVARFATSDEKCVMFALQGTQFGEKEVANLFGEVMSFLFTGFIVDLPNAPQIAGHAVTVSKLAAHIRWVFVSAFDREGVVISELDRQIRPQD